MKNIKLLKVTFGLVVAFFQMFEVGAQILHPVTINKNQNFQYSNYQFTPLAVNPALVGSDGLYRLSTVYSDKSNSVSERPFRQFSISSEYSIMKGFKEGDKIGVGFGAELVGASGASGVSNALQSIHNFIFNTSYHYSLNDAATSFLSFGVQYRTSTSRSYIQLAHISSNTQTGDIGDLINQGNQNVKNIYGPFNINWAAGLLYKSSSANNVKSFGISTFRLNNVSSRDGIPLNQRRYGLNIHGSYDIDIYKSISITPGFFYSNFEFSKLLNINTNVSYWINKEKMSKVYLGLGITDIKRAIIYAGGVFRGINLSLAYDINKTSDDQFSNIQSGIELGASYTGLARKNK
jgi:hypothetical protein